MGGLNKITKDNFYDSVIIGGGPAGLTAAIYLARGGCRVLVIEKEIFGGQITITDEIVNYPGVKKTSGKELSEIMLGQAEEFGAGFMLAEVDSINADGEIKSVHTSRGEFFCFGILIATGAHPRKVGFKGEDEFKGRGVAYCATCDGEFFSGKEIFVIGGGYAAAEESVFLTKFARHVTVFVRESDFTCASSVAEKTKYHEKITVFYDTVVEEAGGENGLEYIRCKNTVNGQTKEFRAEKNENFGLFVFVGYSPDTKLIKNIADLDEQGYVITDLSRMTTADGIYAAGDVCVKPLRQVVTAVGDGAVAATELEKYISAMQAKYNITPEQPVKRKVVNKNEKNFTVKENDDFFTDDIKQQLNVLFERMKQKLILKLYLDNRRVSAELKDFITKFVNLTDKLTAEISDNNVPETTAPCIRIFSEDGADSGLAFHGIPGGHEFTSFVLGIYNAGCEGQKIDESIADEIKKISKKVDMKIIVSLSCTMCPELVTACQRIAAMNKNIGAEVYDIRHFPYLKEKYNIMSVPCLVVNDNSVFFGRKNISQVLSIITGELSR